MTKSIQKITPFLWFDHQAGEAAKFYTSLFSNSKIEAVTAILFQMMRGPGCTKEGTSDGGYDANEEARYRRSGSGVSSAIRSATFRASKNLAASASFGKGF